ncbi:hypothetical protein ACFY36_24920 [Actinoplanes sp. NPDC000266]
MRKSIKRAVVAGTAIAAVGVVGVSYAAWDANTTGKAYAKAETGTNVVVTQATTDASLFPGATGDAYIKVENPNKYPVRISKIAWTPSDGVAATPVAGSTCNNTGVYFGDFSTGPVGTNGVLAGLELDLKAGQTRTFKLKDAVRMINNSENGCQGATFSIPVAVTAASNAS